jgi:hypothetical protein
MIYYILVKKINIFPFMHLIIYPKRVALFLTYIALVLSMASLIGQFCRYVLEWGTNDIIALFNLDYEKNIPSFYASFQLLLSSFLLTAIALAKRQVRDRYSRYWLSLSLIFFYLALDEWFSIHEKLNRPLHKIVQATFGSRWDVLNSILLPIFILIFLKFWLHLPKQIKQLFLWSGTLYILGAIIIEFIGFRYFSYIYFQPRFAAQIITTIEELLEMLGLNLFVYALLIQANHLPIKTIFVELREDPLLLAEELTVNHK